jgi:hypothetical protein
MINFTVITKQSFSGFLSKLKISKNILCIVILFSLFSCSKNSESYIQHLEGYWEIVEVTFPDGNKKEYKFNETIDYISLNDSLEGYRKKLKPGFNDTYFTSDDAESLEVKIENGSLNIYYSTAYANWRETVLEATPNNLRVINKDNIVYLYKRYTSIKLDIE